MNDFLNRIIWGNSMQDYLWTLGVILFVLLLNKIISRAIAWFSCRLFKKQWQTFDRQKFTDLIVHPLGLFLVITVTIVAFYRLHYPPELRFTIYKYSLQRILLSIAVAIQILSFVWVILRIIDFIASVLHTRANITEARNEVQLIVFFRDFIKVLIGVIGIVLVLNQAFGYNVSSLLTGLSIVGAAIALALRESLENLIASFVIFFDKPFTTGDFVRVQNIGGVIERIGLRSTRVRTVDKSYVTVPNKQMVDSILENVSLRSQLRGEINLYLHHHTSADKIQHLLTRIRDYLNTIPEVDAKNVMLNDIRIPGFHVFVEYFTPQMEAGNFNLIKQQINLFILQLIEDLEIRMSEPKEPA